MHFESIYTLSRFCTRSLRLIYQTKSCCNTLIHINCTSHEKGSLWENHPRFTGTFYGLNRWRPRVPRQATFPSSWLQIISPLRNLTGRFIFRLKTAFKDVRTVSNSTVTTPFSSLQTACSGIAVYYTKKLRLAANERGLLRIRNGALWAPVRLITIWDGMIPISNLSRV